MAPADKQWSFSSPMEVMPQSQVVLLQPMVSNSNNTSLKTGSEHVRQSKSSTAFKTYPRIAPHPADATKRPGSSRARVSSASRHEQRERRHHRGHRLYSQAGPQPAPPSPAKALPSFEVDPIQPQAADGDKSLSPLAGPSALLLCSDDLRTETDCDTYQDPLSEDSNKRKRFSNTYNILNKSGLLGITMRTKQLIKENKRTQGQLQQLQEQTTLLLEALSSGDPQLWTKLQLSVQHTDREQWGAKAHRVLE